MCYRWASECNFSFQERFPSLFFRSCLSCDPSGVCLWYYRFSGAIASHFHSLWLPGIQCMPALSVPWVVWNRNQSLRQPSEKLQCLTHVSLFSFLPREKPQAGHFLPVVVSFACFCCSVSSLVLPQLMSSFLFSAAARHPRYVALLVL